MTADDLPARVSGSLNQFLARFEPLRPDLYRYCRQLTRSPWDAEDLAQDALARAFVTLGRMQQAPPNPRAWLFRVASNLWLDGLRRAREVREAAPEPSTNRDPRPAREAAGTLISQLAPQERAAVVLKDVFEFSLEEIAETLSTSPGAVKAALHRGRGKLAKAEPEAKPSPAPAVLDAFCTAFNAQDLAGLLALLLDTSSVEVVGASEEYGPTDARKGMLYGMLFGSQRMAAADPATGMDASLLRGVLAQSPRCELRLHRGEALLLLWYAHADGEAVRAINRVELDGDRIQRVRNYFYSPELLSELCAELGVPFRINGYRHCRST
ncbi:MAG TPA: RNA polymerase sigma factor [Polyangiales bacterium]|nr:RNA polymerase sigma factor [Polyangiales bacterium]